MFPRCACAAPRAVPPALLRLPTLPAAALLLLRSSSSLPASRRPFGTHAPRLASNPRHTLSAQARWLTTTHPRLAAGAETAGADGAEEPLLWYALWRSKRGRVYLKYGFACYLVLLAGAWGASAVYTCGGAGCDQAGGAAESSSAAERRVKDLRLGGHLAMIDHTGKPYDTAEELQGKWWLVYFGFTSCPTVCPAELLKITQTLDTLDKEPALPEVTPVFVTLDPDRDSPEAVAAFLKPYHKRFVGLTGSTEKVKDAAKKFRVYFSVIDTEDQDLQAGQLPEDYQLDHSCIIYLMSPNGKFCEFFSKETDGAVAVEKVRRHLDGTMEHIHGEQA